MAVIAALSLWLRGGFPVHALASANYDDAWFVGMARYLGNLRWLGPYDAMTLIKGMFFPLFVACSALLSVPLLILEHGLYLLASLGIARLLTRDRGAAATAILFGLLAFNPVFWASELNRVIREGLYVTLSLGCVGLAVAASIPAKPGRGRPWLAGSLGLVGGAFWLTREEGPWLLPALGTVFACAALSPGGPGADRLGRAVRVVLPLAVSTSVALAVVLAVCAMNWVTYGVFLTTEFQGGAFPRAYGALARITPDQWQPYVVLPADARARAYAASPAASELAPVLDGPRGRAWAMTGCLQTRTEPCPGILSGWFMWALRDAAATAGHHRTAQDAQRYYDRLAAEINQACGDGRLPCGPPRSGFAPPFRWDTLAGTARSALRLAGIMARVGPRQVGSLPSRGWPHELAAFADMVGPVAPDGAARVVVDGHVADLGAPPQLMVVQASGQAANFQLTTAPYVDLAGGHPGWAILQFQLSTTCVAGCALVVVGADGGTISRPMSSLVPDAAAFDRGPTLHVAGVDARSPLSASAKVRAVRVRVAELVAAAYRWSMPLGLVLAVAGVSASLVRLGRRALSSRQGAFACACLVAALGRLLLLAYLDATSIPSVNDLYASPASPFVIGFVFVGCHMGWSLLRREAA